MTFKELAEWVKTTKKLDEQVIVALEEDKEPDGEEVIVGVANMVCYLPFTAYTIKAGRLTIKGKPWPEDTSSRLCIHIWVDEVAKTVEIPYTWQQLVDWVNTLEDPTIEATALAAWHMCHLKPLQNGILYAYEVD